MPKHKSILYDTHICVKHQSILYLTPMIRQYRSPVLLLYQLCHNHCPQGISYWPRYSYGQETLSQNKAQNEVQKQTKTEFTWKSHFKFSPFSNKAKIIIIIVYCFFAWCYRQWCSYEETLISPNWSFFGNEQKSNF